MIEETINGWAYYLLTALTAFFDRLKRFAGSLLLFADFAKLAAADSNSSLQVAAFFWFKETSFTRTH